MSELAPATLEGWYVLHQMLRLDRSVLRRLDDDARADTRRDLASLLTRIAAPEHGWSAPFQLVGGGADLMLVHFRDSLDALAAAEQDVARAIGHLAHVVHDFTSVTEAGLYHATAEAAAAAQSGSPEYQRILDEAAAAERASAHVQTRLYPVPPAAMRYISFYPMNKRRTHPDNWYALPVDERNRLMREHGLTGRKYAGRVFQVITGAIGLDDWEWGVTLFTAEPLEFKRIVSEMRYDEASTRYGEFGEFFTGIRLSADEAAALL